MQEPALLLLELDLHHDLVPDFVVLLVDHDGPILIGIETVALLGLVFLQLLLL